MAVLAKTIGREEKRSEDMGWRRMEQTRIIAAAGLATLMLSAPALAESQRFFDKAEWEAAVGDYTTLDFTGFEHDELLDDQYADLGVTSPIPTAFFRENSLLYPNDGWGLVSNFSPGINFTFDEPQLWLATPYAGEVEFRLFADGELIGSSAFIAGGLDNFGGIISDIPFDMVQIVDPSDSTVNIDDLYFGIPGPGSLGALVLFVLTAPRCRRSR